MSRLSKNTNTFITDKNFATLSQGQELDGGGEGGGIQRRSGGVASQAKAGPGLCLSLLLSLLRARDAHTHTNPLSLHQKELLIVIIIIIILFVIININIIDETETTRDENPQRNKGDRQDSENLLPDPHQILCLNE